MKCTSWTQAMYITSHLLSCPLTERLAIFRQGRGQRKLSVLDSVSLLHHFIRLRFVNFVITKPLLNTLRPRQNGRHFPDDIFKWIFLNENVWISIYISLKFVPRGPINNIPTLVQVMAWRRPGVKPLSEPMMVRLPTHICVTRPQWVKIVTGQLVLFRCAPCE